MMRSTLRSGLGFLTAAIGLAFQSSSQRNDPGPIKVGPNILVNYERRGNFREPHIAINPANPNQIFGGVSLSHRIPQGGQEDRGYLSWDGGNTWRTIVFPGPSAGWSGDPQTAFGRTGTLLFTTINPPNGIIIYRSVDSGVTWDKPSTIGRGDHEMIWVDRSEGPNAGRVYLAHLAGRGHARLDYHIEVFRSLDDGRTWLGPVELVNNHADTTYGRQVFQVIQFTNGDLFVPIVDYRSTGRSPGDRRNMWFAISKDGAESFSPVAPMRLKDGTQLDQPRNQSPMFTIDRTNGPYRDRVYVLFMDRDAAEDSDSGYRALGSRLVLSYSNDHGATWSTPKPIALGSAGVGDQMSGMPAVNRDGTLAITWYDTKETPANAMSPRIRRYVTASFDGGETFLAPKAVASEVADLDNASRTVLGGAADGAGFRTMNGRGELEGGDYWAFAASPDGSFHAFWPDARTGTYQMWTAKIRIDRPGATGEALPSGLADMEITDSLTVIVDPAREGAAAGTLELPIRLKNRSGRPIYGPLRVSVNRLQGTLLNAANGKSDSTATMDYSRALGDFPSLAPGAVSEAVVWRFAAPTKAGQMPAARLRGRGKM